MKNSPKTRRAQRLFVAALVFLLAVACVAAYGAGYFQRIDSLESIRATLDAAGPYALGAYFALQLLSVIVAPIPSNVTMLAGTLALGFWPTLPLGLCAIFLGSVTTFSAARILGGDAVRRWIGRGTMEKYLPVIEKKQSMFLFLTMLFPFFPDDALCMLAGLTDIPFPRFLAIIVVARPWGLIFAALLGGGVIAVPVWALAILGAVMLACFVLALRYSAAIEDRLFAWVQRIVPERRKKP